MPTVGARPDIVFGNHRRRLRAEIGPVESGKFLHRIGFLFDRLAEITVRRFRRRLQTVALYIVKPAMVCAGKAALLDPAVGKRHTAMGAAIMQKPDLAAGGLEQDQILAEDAQKLGRIFRRQVRRDRHRMPVAPQQFPRRRAGTDFGHHFIFFSGQHFLLLLKHRRIDRAILDSQSSILDPLRHFLPAKTSSINLVTGVTSRVPSSSGSKYLPPSRRRSGAGM